MYVFSLALASFIHDKQFAVCSLGRYEGFIRAVFNANTQDQACACNHVLYLLGALKALFRLYSGAIKALLRLYSGGINALIIYTCVYMYMCVRDRCVCVCVCVLKLLRGI
jgi:hypothetical protein